MKNHEQCHICNKFSCNKYIYYRDFASLESHYEKSHLVCKHGNCEDSKMMQVFENEEMREFHYAERHLGQNFSNKAKKRIECIKLTGFNLVEHNEKPKDNIGVCVEEQLVSVSNRIELKVVDHRDDPIDVREFYQEKWQFTKAMSLGIIAERLMSFGTRGRGGADHGESGLLQAFGDEASGEEGDLRLLREAVQLPVIQHFEEGIL